MVGCVAFVVGTSPLTQSSNPLGHTLVVLNPAQIFRFGWKHGPFENVPQMFSEHPSGIVVVVAVVVVVVFVAVVVVVVFVAVVVVVVPVVVLLNSSASSGQPPVELAAKHTPVAMCRHGPDDPNMQSVVFHSPSTVTVVIGTGVIPLPLLPSSLGLVPFTHATNPSPQVFSPADVVVLYGAQISFCKWMHGPVLSNAHSFKKQPSTVVVLVDVDVLVLVIVDVLVLVDVNVLVLVDVEVLLLVAVDVVLV